MFDPVAFPDTVNTKDRNAVGSVASLDSANGKDSNVTSLAAPPSTDTVNLEDRNVVDPIQSPKADIKDGGASIIKKLLKTLDKSPENDIQYETVSQLGDTSSAVRIL